MVPILQINLNLFFKPVGPIISELRGLSTDFSNYFRNSHKVRGILIAL